MGFNMISYYTLSLRLIINIKPFFFCEINAGAKTRDIDKELLHNG